MVESFNLLQIPVGSTWHTALATTRSTLHDHQARSCCQAVLTLRVFENDSWLCMKPLAWIESGTWSMKEGMEVRKAK